MNIVEWIVDTWWMGANYLSGQFLRIMVRPKLRGMSYSDLNHFIVEWFGRNTLHNCDLYATAEEEAEDWIKDLPELEKFRGQLIILIREQRTKAGLNP